MIDYYKVTPKVTATRVAKETKLLSNKQKISLYLFFGSGIGGLMVAGFAFISFIVILLSREEITGFSITGVAALLFYLLLFYPFALAIGGIPAFLTGWVLNFKRVTTYEKLYAFAVGFIVSFIFYVVLAKKQGIDVILILSLIGGVAAACTKRLIEKKELNLRQTKEKLVY